MSRAIDAMVAERVMGWGQHPIMSDCWATGGQSGGGVYFRQKHYFCPSDDSVHAMEVVEKMRALGHTVRAEAGGKAGTSWQIEFLRGDDAGSWDRIGEAEEEKFPMGVSLAALRAVGVPEDQIEAARRSKA